MTDFSYDDVGPSSDDAAPGFDEAEPSVDDAPTAYDSSLDDDFSSSDADTGRSGSGGPEDPAASWTADDPMNSEVSLPGDLAGPAGEVSEPLFGAAGVTENGDPVDYSQSFHGYYDDRTGEEVEPKWN